MKRLRLRLAADRIQANTITKNGALLLLPVSCALTDRVAAFQKEQNASSNKGTAVALAVAFRIPAATRPRFKALNMTADPKYALIPSFYGLRTNFKIKYSINEGDRPTPPWNSGGGEGIPSSLWT